MSKSVVVVLTYAHLTSRRKTFRTTRNIRVEEDQSKQDLLNAWISQVRTDGVEPWTKIARKMSTKETAYEWFTGTESPLVFPWYDCDAVTFKYPPRSSTEPVVDDDDEEPDRPSFGPGAGGPPGPKSQGASSSSSPADPSASASSTTHMGAGPAPFNAPSFTTTTIHPEKADGAVDVTFRCMEQTIKISVKANLKESEIQRIVANTMQVNLNGYWVATVTEGFGRIGALISGSTVMLTPATPDQIQRVIQARTSATSESATRRTKNHDSRKMTPGTSSPNWLAVQASRERQIDWIEFGQQLERDKMVHVVTDGGARPNPGAAGWGVLMRQSGRYAIWGGACQVPIAGDGCHTVPLNLLTRAW
jgi:hypothetical protein